MLVTPASYEFVNCDLLINVDSLMAVMTIFVSASTNTNSRFPFGLDFTTLLDRKVVGVTLVNLPSKSEV